MSASERASLPYCMGNAGDLLKHGVLAEYVCWRTETGGQVRFLDLFAGEPFDDSSPPEILSRIRNLDSCALVDAQSGIKEGCYLGSAKLVQHLGQHFGDGKIEVYVADREPERCQRLLAEGLHFLDELSVKTVLHEDACRYDAYKFFSDYIGQAKAQDLVLIDPYKDFLPKKSKTVIPQIRKVAERAAVLLFALNIDPYNSVGQEFDALLEEHLPEAITMTCPPVRNNNIEGELGLYADVILASHALGEDGYAKDALLTRLDFFAAQLGQVLGLSNRSRCMLKPRVVGRR